MPGQIWFESVKLLQYLNELELIIYMVYTVLFMLKSMKQR